MIVYYNSNQEENIKKLLDLHRSIMSQDLLLGDLIVQLVEKIRKSILIKKAQIGYDGLLGPLRRIDRAYREHQKTEMCHSYSDEREIYMSTFFHNAKCFFEVSKSTLAYKINTINPILYKDITILRNFFAHSYEKDFLDSKYFVRIEPNHGFENGLFKLNIISLNNEESFFDIYFSFEYFMYQIKQYLEKLMLKL